MDSTSSPSEDFLDHETKDILVRDEDEQTSFYSGLRQGVEVHPVTVYANSFKHRIGNIVRATRSDVQESPHKARTLGLGALTVGTQVLDRARISIILIPQVATEVLNHTHEAIPVGLAAGATFALWNSSMGEVLTQGLGEYPKALEGFKQNFPAVVDIFSESLPGLEEASEKKTSLFRNLGQKALLHLRRAGTGVGIGSTAFVATASAQGAPKSKVRKINLEVSADTGVLIAGVAGATTEAIIKLAENGHVELAKNIQDTITDMRLWYGVAAVSMISEYLANRRKRKQLVTSELSTSSEELQEPLE